MIGLLTTQQKTAAQGLLLSDAIFLLNLNCMYATEASKHLDVVICFFLSAPVSINTYVNKKEIKSFTGRLGAGRGENCHLARKLEGAL